MYCSGADQGKDSGGARSSGATPQSCHDLWLRGNTQVHPGEFKLLVDQISSQKFIKI